MNPLSKHSQRSRGKLILVKTIPTNLNKLWVFCPSVILRCSHRYGLSVHEPSVYSVFKLQNVSAGKKAHILVIVDY